MPKKTKGRSSKKCVQSYPIPTTCPYCSSKVIYTNNKEVYGRKFGNGKCYKCTNCDSYVGVHNGTNIPLGRLANRELRKLKKDAHALFDPQWKNGNKKREHAYRDLAKKLGIPTKECHFGWFDKPMLEKAISILQMKTTQDNTASPKRLVEETMNLLKNDSSLTNEWGVTFIKNMAKIIKDEKKLSDKQLFHIEKQHFTVKQNAKKKERKKETIA
jgi:hypothetical protein